MRGIPLQEEQVVFGKSLGKRDHLLTIPGRQSPHDHTTTLKLKRMGKRGLDRDMRGHGISPPSTDFGSLAIVCTDPAASHPGEKRNAESQAAESDGGLRSDCDTVCHFSRGWKKPKADNYELCGFGFAAFTLSLLALLNNLSRRLRHLLNRWITS